MESVASKDALTRDQEPEASRTEQFLAAKADFQALMDRDFPDFTIEAYSAEKAAAEGIETESLATKLWSVAEAVPNRLDLTGDGKIGLDDAGQAVRQAADGLGKAWRSVTEIDKEDVADAAAATKKSVLGAGKKVFGFDYGGMVGNAAKRVQESVKGVDADSFRSSGHTLAKIGKSASGIQGLQDRKEAISLKETAERYAETAEALTEERRAHLYERIEEFGALRLEALHETLGRFLAILRALNQQNREKEYELLDGLGIDTERLESLGNLDMTVSQSLRSTAATGALGIAAVLGTPALVTGSVAALATASTGTAISTLSGAAASNAVLAWLGGGSLAAGGGGMAAGAVVLTGITVGATAGVTLLAAGILVSTHYSAKLTDAKVFQKETALAVAGLQNAWIVMDGILARIDELSTVTEGLRQRANPVLDQLESLVPVFDAQNPDHAATFNQCGQLIKTMVELAQVPLFDSEGELSDESLTVSLQVRKILNTEFEH